MNNSYTPLFPLEAFLLPGEFFQLHIFEPRYKQMVAHAMEGDKRFGIPFFHITNGRNLGSMVEIIDVYNENELGECDIAVRCTDLFIVKHFTQKISAHQLYPGGEIAIWKSNWNPAATEETMADFQQYLLKNNMQHSRWIVKDTPGLVDILTTLNPNVQDKLQYVLATSSSKREAYVRSFLKYFELLSDQEDQVYNNLYLN